jgi:hypothetical protein
MAVGREGRIVGSFPTSKQHTELLRSRPYSRVQYDLEALRVFVEWAEASRVPQSPEISLLIKRFASDVKVQARAVDVDLIGRQVVDELLQWIESSREVCSLPDAGIPVVSMFLSYQDEIRAYKNRIKNYWSN